MNYIEIAMVATLTFMHGLMVGYIVWAPETSFKRGFVDGLSLKFLWGKK
jgi:hypothetical protein